MKPKLIVLAAVSLVLSWAALPAPAAADASHARIVRLSLIQGDVRFARDFHHDSLTDAKAVWEVAPLNLPIRQGFAVATDNNARAEVEFENGAMAFLGANTVIEFYDLSLDEGAVITRLVLRQGSAIFYVHPAKGDYFSVTGGDFSVEANGRSRFRLDNFDDGSTVNVELGHVNVLRSKTTKALEKGQTYSINVNDGSAPEIGRTGDSDDFDKWVSGRIDSVATATAYSNQYLNSPAYSAGFADLYSYGSWYSVPGYGYGWQPFGMGMGWDPFNYGSWYYDPSIGWNFIGAAAWGWLPYHYGGWLMSPIYGWVWIPSGFGYFGPIYYRPVTAVWVHSGTTTGLVPVHPADTHGKPPLNLSHGVYAVHGNMVSQTLMPNPGEKWSVTKHPSGGTLSSSPLTATAPPARVTRTILSGNAGSRAVTLSRDSSIGYDPGQRRFVNTNEPPKVSEARKTENGTAADNGARASVTPGTTARGSNAPVAPPRGSVAPRPNVMPPQPPHSTSPSHAGGATWSGASSGGSMGSTSHSSSPAPASHSSSSGGHH